MEIFSHRPATVRVVRWQSAGDTVGYRRKTGLSSLQLFNLDGLETSFVATLYAY